ncbi:HEPN domain-containing protein [Nocardia barduliensis]|uniref:ApeA N-terminal domain 1-containing protein n=1 Tax=Nocardia barduliensis TaxID=2736643 RepID=UPI00157414D3|nr:HEPN domain-containing protein [Nocardia barduliensis]
MPIKVKQLNGRFSCQWYLPDPDADVVLRPHGEIILDGSRQPLGKVSGEVPGEPFGGFPKRYEYEYLSGQLANGAGALLINPKLEIIGHPGHFVNFPDGNATIYASAALIGRDADQLNDTKISEMRVQITHLERIFMASPIDTTTLPMQSDSKEAKWSVTTRSNDLEWYDGSTKMSITYMQSATVLAEYEFGIRFTPIIKISFDEPLEFLDAYDKWIRSLYRVISVLTGKEEDVTYLEVKPAGAKENSPFLQAFARPITQSPYMPERGRLRRQRDSALKLDADKVSLLNLVNRWNTLEDDQNPIVYTYEPYALGADQHPRARYLLLIQALEGVSNREGRLNERVEGFARKRDRVINECMKHLTGMSRKFVRKNIKKTPLNLDDLLKDMFESLPVDPTEKIGQATLVERVCTENTLKPEGALRLIRNDLAHGNKTYDFYELSEVDTILESVVRAHCLRILGMSSEVQERVLSFDD